MIQFPVAVVLALGMPAAALSDRLEAPSGPETLTVGVVQLALECDLDANRDKMLAFMRQAKASGCRVVIFPESALYSPPETTRSEIDTAVEVLCEAAGSNGIYSIFCVRYKRDDGDSPFERLMVVGPDGRVIHTYDKLWQDRRFDKLPGLFYIDGAPCGATICADRWLRGVEELPVLEGARILFECSNNYANEWIDDLGWYWYMPRALRNEVYVVFANTAKENQSEGIAGHGHSAVIAPDGGLVTSAGGESDRLLVATLDLTKASRGEAERRRSHPLFRPFWDVGVALMNRRSVEVAPFQVAASPPEPIRIAAAQMACSQHWEDNVTRMKEMIHAARTCGADVIIFPELVVTGTREADIMSADERVLHAALARVEEAARRERIAVVFGMPWVEGGKRQNCAFVLDSNGAILTRYAQIVVERPELFAPGMSTKSLWFQIKGIRGVVTLGADARWSEIAELAALRGAQVHFHLAYDRDSSDEGTFKRRQFWANLASFRTLTATVNAASPDGLARPSEPAAGGSTIWEDFHRASSGRAGGYAPHCAVRLAEAKQGETILFATQTVQNTNPHFNVVAEKTNPQMVAWYAAGAKVIDIETDSILPATQTLRGRIAWSADGNHNDPDDWAASPVALAILAECGSKDRLVHFDYNCILPRTDPEWQAIHAESVLGAAERYSYDKSVFHDCQKDLDAAIASIARAINSSSADNPLYFILAGPMEVPFRGIERSDPAKRKFVYCISHSRWNDGFATQYQFTHTKRSVISLGVNWVQIQDQNRLLARGQFGRASTADEEWAPYHWMLNSEDPKLRFLWERMVVSTRPDPSDAGMAYFLMTGDEEADPGKLRRLLNDKVVPAPIRTRTRVRIEAENFRDLVGYELEDRNDKDASHRLSVKCVRQDGGRIRTRFDEPFTAERGRYDVDVRYLDQRDQPGRFEFFVNGVAQGDPWRSPGTGQGWTTQRVAAVEIDAGDEITVTTQGPAGPLDYVQLNYRKPD